ncbi:MAG TPA: TetR/AcrR family transcriptional regulator [Oscillospiraceae bacterium]|nr:TetR/AcrR family transcriptional regulator [Oscillospiraceae bacterium]HPF55018.1 TetR/AcrR family transcriptional regulator [Clostridiales bacterium]HPK35914.1 TetR/AcrR family transcriptional regulator [Oscillospiraceae bacterium]HPR75608.1 TetR/AcrR family transcriptional regulator [Oscillospiraceae bacterium]
MADQDLKTRIKEAAVRHFNDSGYYGTTIRHIADDVNCSLPMIYYYYKSKKELFDEIIKKEFFDLVRRQASSLKIDNPVDFYTKFVFSLNSLSNYDRQVYRLGTKVYLSFDGDEELMGIMDKWEKTIFPRHYNLLLPYLKNADNAAAVVRTLIHLLETMIESIVVKNRYLPKNEIREEIAVVLHSFL